MSHPRARTVLLVEDEALIRLSQKTTLERNGFHVTAAESGEKAVGAVAEGRPVDLVLMDIDLGGGMDGIEASQRILAHRDLPIVFLTSHAEKPYVERAREITSYGYVLKHSGPFVLVETIRQALELFDARLELEHSQRLYRSVADLAGEVVVRVDESGRWVFVNREAERVWGISPDEAVGRRYMDLVHPEDREKTDEALSTMRDRHEPITGLTNRQWTRVGWRVYEWNSAPVLDEHGVYRGFQATGRDVTDRTEFERSLEAALREKQHLMKELNHRVKNNLAMVSSLIRLKAERLGETADLSDLQNQVRAISGVYEQLQQSKAHGEIEFAPYAKGLLSGIFSQWHGRPVEVRYDIEDLTVHTRTATTLGLIVNELATNAMKHGFTARATPRFEIGFRIDEKTREYVLTASSSGKAFPADVDVQNPRTLGLQLIAASVHQRGGTIELQREPQPVFTIRLPVGER